MAAASKTRQAASITEGSVLSRMNMNDIADATMPVARISRALLTDGT
jgi:hypothetical protein